MFAGDARYPRPSLEPSLRALRWHAGSCTARCPSGSRRCAQRNSAARRSHRLPRHAATPTFLPYQTHTSTAAVLAECNSCTRVARNVRAGAPRRGTIHYRYTPATCSAICVSLSWPFIRRPRRRLRLFCLPCARLHY
ncbi:hypothetical protein C2E23DRAFT_845831 [Lenzites betulinus]|nr:hypothetical protein C2E23DRAFT_845831 [Lenzites betulinus]